MCSSDLPYHPSGPPTRAPKPPRSVTPNRPVKIEYRADTDLALNERDFVGRDLENPQEPVSRPLDIESNVGDGWDCPHSGHLPVFDMARHKQRAMVRDQSHAKRSMG